MEGTSRSVPFHSILGFSDHQPLSYQKEKFPPKLILCRDGHVKGIGEILKLNFQVNEVPLFFFYSIELSTDCAVIFSITYKKILQLSYLYTTYLITTLMDYKEGVKLQQTTLVTTKSSKQVSSSLISSLLFCPL